MYSVKKDNASLAAITLDELVSFVSFFSSNLELLFPRLSLCQDTLIVMSHVSQPHLH